MINKFDLSLIGCEVWSDSAGPKYDPVTHTNKYRIKQQISKKTRDVLTSLVSITFSGTLVPYPAFAKNDITLYFASATQPNLMI